MSLFGDTTPGAIYDASGKQVGTMEPAAPATAAPVIVDAASAPTPENNNGTPAANSAAAPASNSSEIDWSTHLSEKTGGKFSSWEELTAKLNEPQSPATINYANEESKQLAELLQAGKIDDVLEVYNQQKILSSVKDMSDEDVVKMALGFKHSHYTLDDINDDYSAKYKSLEKPEAPVQDDYVDDDDYNKALKTYNKDLSKYEKAEKALTRQLKSEAVEARTYLQSLQKQISLPTIQPTTPQSATSDPEMEKKAREKYLSSLTQSSTAFKEIPFEISEDGFAFKGSFQVDDGERSSLSKAMSGDNVIEDQFLSRYVKGDSLENIQYDTALMMRDLYIRDNFEKILKNAVKQAVASVKLEQAKGLKNVDLGGAGGTGNFVPDEKAAKKEFAGNFFAAG